MIKLNNDCALFYFGSCSGCLKAKTIKWPVKIVTAVCEWTESRKGNNQRLEDRYILYTPATSAWGLHLLEFETAAKVSA